MDVVHAHRDKDAAYESNAAANRLLATNPAR
jgi:hypothetical protein